MESINERENANDAVEPSENRQREAAFMHSSASVPNLHLKEDTPLLQEEASRTFGYRTIHPSKSYTTIQGTHPYTQENKPKRRPFHLTPERRHTSEPDSHLYARFRYYSRLRAPAPTDDLALVIPDHIIPTDFFLFYIPGTSGLRDRDGKTESYITIAAIWNTMMGTSLLTMPWAVSQAGLLGAVIIMVGEAGVCLYTACKLLTLQRTMGMQGEMHELGYLFRALWPGSLGKGVEGMAVTFSVLTLLGALVVYWVLMSNFLYNTGEGIYLLMYGGDSDVNSTVNAVGVICPPNITEAKVTSFISPDDPFDRFWKEDLSVPLLLVIPFVFLLSIKNTSVFTYFNSFGAISVLAIYLFVVVKAASWGFNFTLFDGSSPFFVPLFENTFMALSGTLSLAYFIHNCVITILKGNKQSENNVRDLSIAYILVALTYIPIGIIFYLSFPLPKFCLVDNFLDNFPPHNLTLAVARLFLLFQMLTVFPLLSYFLRSQLLTYIFGPGATHSWKHISIINFIILALSVCVSIFYPNIGFILRWVGAISGLAYIFVLPPLTNMQANRLKGTLTWKDVIVGLIIMLLGVMNFTLQFFLS